jgi:hypothetical protein
MNKLESIKLALAHSFEEPSDVVRAVRTIIYDVQDDFSTDDLKAIFRAAIFCDDWREEPVYEEVFYETKKFQQYILIKEYEGSPKLGSIIQECSARGQFVHRLKCYYPPFNSEYWERLPDKEVKSPIIG